MNQLVSSAARGVKPSKDQAQQIIRDLAETYPEAVPHLARLYAHFMPQRPKNAKAGFAWVAQAMGKRDRREYLNLVYVDERHVTATDGHRMHRMSNDVGLPTGYYLSNGDKAYEADWHRYPDVDRIIPTLTGAYQETEVVIADLDVIECGKIPCYALPSIVDGRVVAVPKTQFDAATAGLDVVTLRHADWQSPVYLEPDGDRQVVIIPVRQ